MTGSSPPPVGCDSPIRVLQVVGSMNRAGVETWLMHVLRGIDRQRYRMDFLVHTNEPQAFDAEIRALGSRTLVCPHPRQPWRYRRELGRVLERHGPYDVLHGHLHHFSGCALRIAHHHGVPCRIAHSHLDSRSVDAGAGILRRSYLRGMRRRIERHANVRLACSRDAAASLFGGSWERSGCRVLFCGIDLGPFQATVDRLAIRAALGFSPDAVVIGHVGRFHEQKNHPFLIRVAAEVARREPRTRLLLVGDGPLRSEIERDLEASGLSDRTVLAGVRDDVPSLMLGAMDLFLFPSRYEGLGLVLLEAQAAGLPCVISSAVPQEATVARALSRRLDLEQPVSDWASAVLAGARAGFSTDRRLASRALKDSPFDIEVSARSLATVYEASLSKGREGRC